MIKRDSSAYELIVRYGKLIERKMQLADSREKAEEFAEKIYQSFDSQCKSEIIKNSFKRYVSDVLQKRWGESHDSKRHNHRRARSSAS